MFDKKELDRFWSHIDKDGPLMPGMSTKCWNWIGRWNRKLTTYGIISMNGKGRVASRVSYSIHYNWIDDPALVVCHKCDNPPCCNPEHLFLGTQADNIKDAWAKGKYVYSEKRRREMSKRVTGPGNPMYGVIGESNPHFGMKRSLEARRNMSEAQKKINRRKITKEEIEDVLKIWDSTPRERRNGLQTYLAEVYHVDTSTISRIVNRKPPYHELF